MSQNIIYIYLIFTIVWVGFACYKQYKLYSKKPEHTWIHWCATITLNALIPILCMLFVIVKWVFNKLIEHENTGPRGQH